MQGIGAGYKVQAWLGNPSCLGHSLASSEAQPLRHPSDQVCVTQSSDLSTDQEPWGQEQVGAGPRNSTHSGSVAWWVGTGTLSSLEEGNLRPVPSRKSARCSQHDSGTDGAERWKRCPTPVRATPLSACPEFQSLSSGFPGLSSGPWLLKTLECPMLYRGG